jgi:tetratricopeptide (TPR) repeat protein
MTSSPGNEQFDSSPADSLVVTFPDESSTPKDMLLWAGVLVLLALVSYWPATDGKFIWNDDVNVSRNQLLLQPGGLGRIWTQRWSDPTKYPMPQYHPFTYTIYWLEFQMFGRDTDGQVNPIGFHITNLALAAGSAVLVWLILHNLKVPGAWVAAAMFAVHPLNTESIAWISQLASVLAGILFFAAIFTFLQFTEDDQKAKSGTPIDPARQWGFYAASLALFIFGMLSKSTAFAMPFVTLLILWWQRRLRARYFALLLPMMFIGVAMAFSAADFERVYSGFQPTNLTVPGRLIVTGKAIWFYAGKVLLPIRLTFLYPKWAVDAGNFAQFLPLIAAVFIIAVLWFLHKRLGRGPAVAVSAFVLCLLPAMGFFDQVPMRFTFVADHYAYLASVPLIALVVAAATRALRRAKLQNSHGRAAVGLSAVFLVTLASMSWVRAHVFSGDLDLWQDTVAKNPESWFARDRYATALGAVAEAERDAGDGERYANDLNLALEQAQQAATINPQDAEGQWILGRIYVQQKKLDQAILHLNNATTLDPDLREPWQDLATALISQNRFEEAVTKLDAALRLEPRSSAIHRLLGEAYGGLGNNQRSLSEFRLALEYKPDNFVAREHMADLLARAGMIKEAMYQYTLILQAQQNRADLWYKVAILFTAENDLEHAIDFFKTTLRTDPNYPNAQKNLELAEKMLRQQATTRAATMPATRGSK